MHDFQQVRSVEGVDGSIAGAIANHNHRRCVVNDLLNERKAQDERWGEQNHPDGTGGAQWQAAADGAKRMYEQHVKDGTVTFLDVLREEVYEAFAESDEDMLRAELIQVAAVALCWVEKIDRARYNEMMAQTSERIRAIMNVGGEIMNYHEIVVNTEDES